MDDSAIIQLFWERSESAITELSKKYGDYCLRLSANILPDRQDGQECVNDAYLALWDAIPPARPDSLRAYLSRVVRNLSCGRADYRSAAKRDDRHRVCIQELDQCFPAPDTPESTLESRQITQTINAFLDQLDKTNRIIFVRRYYYFDTCKQIGKRVGLSESAVTTRLQRLRERLRKALEKEEIFV